MRRYVNKPESINNPTKGCFCLSFSWPIPRVQGLVKLSKVNNAWDFGL